MKVAARLAELCAIRDRDLTDAEQREVKALAKRDRWNKTVLRRCHSDPDYRQTRRARSAAWWKRAHPRMEAAE